MSKMTKYPKTAYLFLTVSAILTVVAAVLAIVSCSAPNGAYIIVGQDKLITFSVAAAALILVTLALGALGVDKVWSGLLPIAATALIGICFYILFMGKIDLMGTVWFSELDQGNKVAESAMNLGAASMIAYLVAGFALAIGSGFNLAKVKDVKKR